MTDTELITPIVDAAPSDRYGGLEADDTWLCEDIAWEIAKLEEGDLPDCEPPPADMFEPSSHVRQLLVHHPRVFAGYALEDWMSLNDAIAFAGAPSLASLIKAVKLRRVGRSKLPTELAKDAHVKIDARNDDRLDIRELAALLRGTDAEDRARALLLELLQTI